MGGSRRRATPTAPAQNQPGSPHQAELVTCDKTIERSFAWFGRSRRLSKDYEFLPVTSETWLYLATSRLLLRRLATM